MEKRLDLDKPFWDQSTFMGRLKYFSWVTDPRLSLYSKQKLLEAKTLVEKYRKGDEPPGTTVSQVKQAQRMYLSAFHPDTGDLQNVIGRMSFYVPGGMVLIGAMITFYKSNAAVIFWQWANQSFNALVNYTNRNAQSEITPQRIGVAYVSATGCALVTGLGLKAALATRASPLAQRFVPFAAVAAANMVNIPLMRQSELLDGVAVFDDKNNKVTDSRSAAIKGISLVVVSRIIMAAPSMLVLPLGMERLEKTAWLKKYRFLNAPLQVFLSGLTLLVMVPVGCALFDQRCSISTSTLKKFDKTDLNVVEKQCGQTLPSTVYFNKGL
ncbi:Sideroflexin-2 [Mactra antiquata]